MTPSETTALISSVGGDAAFGRLLGIDSKDGWQQRVNNWKRRGMPSSVILQHYEVIQQLREEQAAKRHRRKAN